MRTRAPMCSAAALIPAEIGTAIEVETALGARVARLRPARAFLDAVRSGFALAGANVVDLGAELPLGLRGRRQSRKRGERERKGESQRFHGDPPSETPGPPQG